VWVHSSAFSAIVAPARGGAIVEHTHFASGINYADTLTRRREAYHLPPLNEHRSERPGEGASAVSIHDLESGFGLAAPPPVDLDDRAIGVARVLPAGLTRESYASAQFQPVASWARSRCDAEIVSSGECLEVRCRAREGRGGFSITWSFTPDGVIEGAWTWDTSAFGDGDRFAPELTLAAPVRVDAPLAADVWRDSVETHAKSERGLERVRQGECVTPLFDARAGVATLTLYAGRPSD